MISCYKAKLSERRHSAGSIPINTSHESAALRCAWSCSTRGSTTKMFCMLRSDVLSCVWRLVWRCVLAWVDSIGDDGVDCSFHFRRREMTDRKIVAIRALKGTDGRNVIARNFGSTT